VNRVNRVKVVTEAVVTEAVEQAKARRIRLLRETRKSNPGII
jgi:hypothetical protein